jgi:glycosyltransferase involved in cell wall biosynthesis
VIASLVHIGVRRIIDLQGVAGCDVEKAQGLRDFAISELIRTTLHAGSQQNKSDTTVDERRVGTRLFSCDVIVCCSDESDQTVAAIKSVINQLDVLAFVHLIDDGGLASKVMQLFGGRERVTLHRNQVPLGLLSTTMKLLPRLRSTYVAFQNARSISRPDRLKQTIDLLERQGGEIGAATVRTENGVVVPTLPPDLSKTSLPWQSIVMRRNTLLDLQRIHGSDFNSIDSLVSRAVSDGRKISLSRRVTVDINDRIADVEKASPAVEKSCQNSPLSFASLRRAIDVVLPFHNTIEFVYESLQSVLAQNGVDVVVHLIDDASTVDTSPHLEHWRREPRIRVYRNSQNIGPYVSLNNVSRFFETEFAAIQDADDVSLPHRLCTAITSLEMSSSDIFGAAVEMFGDIHERVTRTDISNSDSATRPVKQFRLSRYPEIGRLWCFIINPTMVVRVSTFNRLGGFADYGELKNNRCGLDAEFCARAYLSGCKFYVSPEIVVRQRRHADSLTQNHETGWGTVARNFARQKVLERIELYRQYNFDPQDFGGRNNYLHLTERVS